MSPAFDPTDWITMWQSEMAARAVDREAHEFIAQYAEAWYAKAWHDGAAGRASPHAPPGPAPLGAAPDAVRDGLEQLRQQLEALQRGHTG